MNQEKHFLEAISAGEPNADLIYADWLEEQGRPEADEIRDPIVVISLDVSQSWSTSWFGSQFRSRSFSQFRSWCRSNLRFCYQSCSRFGSGYVCVSQSLCQSVPCSQFWSRCRSWSKPHSG